MEAVKEEVLSNRHILGIHDLMIHNYGPSKIIMSLHAEVPSNGNVLELHDVIDNMEKQQGINSAVRRLYIWTLSL